MAEPVMLAKKYDPDKHGVINWYMSEKLDGVRAVYSHGKFTTRNGNVLDAPYRILGPLEKLAVDGLDGELYLGRGRFDECSGIVRRNEDAWIGIEFRIFDVINWPNARFSTRYQLLRDGVAPHLPAFAKLVEQIPVVSIDTLLDYHQRLIDDGAEGVILKNPDSHYQFKRSSDMLKLKKFHDFEARVIDFEVGKGKYAGMIGALVCRLPNGKVFSCGSGLVDADRLDFTKFDGQQITVKYFELTKDGIPRFPIFKGIRHDV